MNRRSTALFPAVFGLCGILFVLAGCSRKNTAGSGDLLSRIQSKGEIVIATEGTWSPWTYHDEQDRLVGFDVEVAEQIAQKLGVQAHFVETEWDGIFAGIDSKRYDISLNGIEVTEERQKKYHFSTPYGYIHTAIITRSDTNDIQTFEALKDRKTANSLGSTYADLAESYGAKVSTIDSFEETILLLTQGRIDATLNADASFYDYMKIHPDTQIQITCLSPDASQVAAIIRKDADCESLYTAVNQALEQLLQEGEIRRISEKYFGSDISAK